MRLIDAGELSAEQLRQTRTIYEDAFSPQLRAPFERLLTERMLVLVDEGRPLGLAVLRPLGDTGWIFLRYLAVGDRGLGTGGRLWALLRDSLLGAGPVAATRIVLDVEDPDEPGVDEPERELRRRRIGFYQRLGARLPHVLGYQPPHDGVRHVLRPMIADLMLSGPTWVDPAADLRAVLLAVYEHRYGVAPDAAEVREVLARSGLADWRSGGLGAPLRSRLSNRTNP